MAADPRSPAPRWLDAAEHEAWRSTAMLLIRLPAQLDAEMTRRCGLTFFEYSLLAVLSESPERTRQMSEIAAATSSSLSRLSHVATRLEGRGLIRRTRMEGPGRRTNATLTEEGTALVVEVAPTHVEIVRELVLDRLTPTQLTTFGRLAGRIAAGDDCPPR